MGNFRLGAVEGFPQFGSYVVHLKIPVIKGQMSREIVILEIDSNGKRRRTRNLLGLRTLLWTKHRLAASKNENKQQHVTQYSNNPIPKNKNLKRISRNWVKREYTHEIMFSSCICTYAKIYKP